MQCSGGWKMVGMGTGMPFFHQRFLAALVELVVHRRRNIAPGMVECWFAYQRFDLGNLLRRLTHPTKNRQLTQANSAANTARIQRMGTLPVSPAPILAPITAPTAM